MDSLHGAAFDELRATIQRRLIEAGRKQAGFSPAAAPGGGGARVPAATRGGTK